MFHLMIVRNVEFDLQNLENAMSYKDVFPRNLADPLFMVQMKKTKKKQNHAVYIKLWCSLITQISPCSFND